MKPTKSIYILLSLFLMFSCEEDTQTNEDTDDMMSLDWILLKKGVTTNFYVESCDGYIECSYYEFYNENNDTYYTYCDMDEYESYNCKCDEYDNECGECRLELPNIYRVNSCDGYELCGNYTFSVNCCYEGEFIGVDEYGNPTDNYYGYYVYEYPFNEYTLYWNDDVDVCEYNCDEESLVYYDYDIVIPKHIPNYELTYCGSGDYDYCSVNSFHPNCDTPLDTTMMIGSKNISFEKMGWFERDRYDNQFGYIHYYPLDKYLIFEGGDDLDLSNYKIVDYQRKE